MRNEFHMCEKCGKKFIFKDKMLLHKERHKSYPCKQCNSQFLLISDLNKHISSVHIDAELLNYSLATEDTNFGINNHNENFVQPQMCRLCDKVLGDYKQIKLHLYNHKIDDRFQCLFCNSVIKAQGNMGKHIKLHHLSNELYTCNICGKKFKEKGNMIKHIARHKGTKPYSCSQCNRKFTVNLDLKKHLMYVHSEEKPFECDICKTKYKTVERVRSHIKNSHIGLQYPCAICGKVFTHCSERLRYVFQHIGVKKIRFRKKQLYKESTQNVCKLCEVDLHSRSELRLHLLAYHSNERRFVCTICKKSYMDRSSLHAHNRSAHSGKIVSCCECNKTFKSRKNLILHMRNHSDERPYVCECGKTFKRASYLNSHIKHNHSSVSQYAVIFINPMLQ